MFIKRPTQKHGNYLILSSIWKSYLTLSDSSFHYHQQVDHQNVKPLTLNSNQERPTMKKTSNNLKCAYKSSEIAIQNRNLRN